MPTMTVTISDTQWERLKPALQRYRDPLEHPDETDAELAKRWLRMKAHDAVWSHERDKLGADNAVPDFDMEVE